MVTTPGLDLEVITCEADGTMGSIIATPLQQHTSGHGNGMMVSAVGAQGNSLSKHERKLMSQLEDAGNVNNLRKVIQMSCSSYGPWHFRY